jgi:hypothetical protein
MRTPTRVRNRKGSLAEFGPVVWILFVLIVFPLIDLMGVVTGMANIVLLTHQAVSRAANQQTYDNALAAMAAEATNNMSSGFARLAKLQAVGGYQACGMNLYVNATDYRSGGTTKFGPNTPVPPPIDPTKYIYEVTASAQFQTGPFIDLSGIPILGLVPGLGKPADLTFSASRSVEHPSGLGRLNSDPNNTATVTAFNRTIRNTVPIPPGTIVSASNLSGFDNSGWNYPGIYDAIARAGQTIVAENVLIVDANAPWVTTGITVSPGETIWLDTRANGVWSTSTTSGLFNANGYPTGLPQYNVDASAVQGALIGCVGTPPVVAVASGGINSPQFFVAGQTLTMYPVTGTGTIYLQNNDNYLPDDMGQQLVRIIITR